MLADAEQQLGGDASVNEGGADGVHIAGTTVADVASDMVAVSEAVADAGEQAMSHTGEAIADAPAETAQAFEAARERLHTLATEAHVGTQASLSQAQSGTEALGKHVGATYATAMQGMAEFNSKAIEAWRTNAEAAIRHWQKLASAKNLSEAIALSAEHTRVQLETVGRQTRELSALATRIVRDAASPMKTSGH